MRYIINIFSILTPMLRRKRPPKYGQYCSVGNGRCHKHKYIVDILETDLVLFLAFLLLLAFLLV